MVIPAFVSIKACAMIYMWSELLAEHIYIMAEAPDMDVVVIKNI